MKHYAKPKKKTPELTINTKTRTSLFVCSQFMNEMIGELFSPIDMPEPPKESFSFVKGLFGGGARNLDREELCEYFIHFYFEFVI